MSTSELSIQGPLKTQGIVERWLAEIRRRMPTGALLTATLQVKPQRGFLACFKVRTEEETLSSEARSENPEDAVKKAGEGICAHLPPLEEDGSRSLEHAS